MSGVIPVLLAGFIFAFLYTQEKNFALKYLFLFVALWLVAFSFIFDYQLTSTTLNSGSGTTTYSYALSNNYVPLVYALSVLTIGVMLYFIYIFITSWLLKKRG
ncbi:MAG: hypothetical protein QW478_12770 [Candidatus Micrarchaeaceae archaeon]